MKGVKENKKGRDVRKQGMKITPREPAGNFPSGVFPDGMPPLQKSKLHFYSKYFNYTVGVIAIKRCDFNSFQHFKILLSVQERRSKIGISLRKEKKNVKQICSLWPSWVSFYFDNQFPSDGSKPNSSEPFEMSFSSQLWQYLVSCMFLKECHAEEVCSRLKFLSDALPFQINTGTQTETDTINKCVQ